MKYIVFFIMDVIQVLHLHESYFNILFNRRKYMETSKLYENRDYKNMKNLNKMLFKFIFQH